MQALSSIVCSLACALGIAGDRGEDPAGVWSGRLQTPEVAARIELALERDGTVWKGELTAFTPRELRSRAIDLVVDGERLRFHAAIAEADVAFEGDVANGLVLGEIVVSQDGSFHTRGFFGLARRDAGEAGEARVDAFLASQSVRLDERERDQALLALDRLLRTKYEGLAFDLRALKRVTLVGERTGGGAHAGRWYPLSEHFAAFIPTTRATSVFVEGDWEGVGVAPDVEIAAEGALQRARELVLERRIARTTDAERRAALERELEGLRR